MPSNEVFSPITNRRTVGKSITTTALTTMYTCDVKVAHMASVHAANASTVSETVTISWFDSSASATYDLITAATVTAGSYFRLEFNDGFVLRKNDEIRVTAGSADELDVIVTIIEPIGNV